MKNQYRYAFVIVISLLFVSNNLCGQAKKAARTLERDTTLILAYEICSDSTIFNCWFENENEFPLQGLLEFNLSDSTIDYDKIFIYKSAGLNPNSVDSIDYLGISIDSNDSSYVFLKRLESKNPMVKETLKQYKYYYLGSKVDSVIKSKFYVTNKLVLDNKKLDNKLRKIKYQKRILKDYPLSMNQRSQHLSINSQRIFYLFKIHFSYVNSGILKKRTYLPSNENKLKSTIVKCYYINDLFSIQPYNFN